MVLHGHDPMGGDATPSSGQPIVGNDPTQGAGTPAWQQALRMGLVVNARNRRN